MDLCQSGKESLTPTEYRRFRRMLGALTWVASTTRPDIAVSVSRLASFATDPTTTHFNQSEKIRRYLMSTIHESLVYQRLNEPVEVIAFSDAAFQNLPDAGSQGGMLISLAQHPTHHKSTATPACLISWKSSRIKRVVRSTFAGELLQCSSTFDHAAHVRDLYDEICGRGISGKTTKPDIKTPLVIRTDCQDVIDHLRSLRNTCSEKRLNKEVHLLRSSVTTGEVSIYQHVRSESMMADGLTKESPKLREPIIRAMRGQCFFEPLTKTNHLAALTIKIRMCVKYMSVLDRNVSRDCKLIMSRV